VDDIFNIKYRQFIPLSYTVLSLEGSAFFSTEYAGTQS